MGLKFTVPVPLEWVITNVPLGNLTVAAVLLVSVLAPPAVNTPVAMMLEVFEVAEVVMNWKCSVPDTAVRALAAARLAPPRTAVTETAPIIAANVLRMGVSLLSGAWLPALLVVAGSDATGAWTCASSAGLAKSAPPGGGSWSPPPGGCAALRAGSTVIA